MFTGLYVNCNFKEKENSGDKHSYKFTDNEFTTIKLGYYISSFFLEKNT